MDTQAPRSSGDPSRPFDIEKVLAEAEAWMQQKPGADSDAPPTFLQQIPLQPHMPSPKAAPTPPMQPMEAMQPMQPTQPMPPMQPPASPPPLSLNTLPTSGSSFVPHGQANSAEVGLHLVEPQLQQPSSGADPAPSSSAMVGGHAAPLAAAREMRQSAGLGDERMFGGLDGGGAGATDAAAAGYVPLESQLSTQSSAAPPHNAAIDAGNSNAAEALQPLLPPGEALSSEPSAPQPLASGQLAASASFQDEEPAAGTDAPTLPADITSVPPYTQQPHAGAPQENQDEPVQAKGYVQSAVNTVVDGAQNVATNAQNAVRSVTGGASQGGGGQGMLYSAKASTQAAATAVADTAQNVVSAVAGAASQAGNNSQGMLDSAKVGAQAGVAAVVDGSQSVINSVAAAASRDGRPKAIYDSASANAQGAAAAVAGGAKDVASKIQAQAPHGWYDENGRTPSWDLGSVAFLLVAGAWSLCSYCFE